MAITIPLKEMTVAEKIQAMESIWEDLCSHAENLSSPAWHEDVLAEREEMQQRGEDQFEDWETAKKNIRNKIS